MASRRRRRRGEDDSDDLSENESNEKEKCVNRDHDDHLSEDLELSEYESLDDESEDYATSESEDESPSEATKKKLEQVKVEEERDLANEETVIEEKEPQNKETVIEEKEPKNEETVIEEKVPKKIQILPNTKRESGDGKEESEKEHSPERTLNKDELTFKHEEGDEEEKVDDKEVNPAFTPRAGAFFQHDMRTDDKARNFRPNFGQRDAKKWTHDRFILEEQMPKTNTDIYEEYGFDLRKQKEAEILIKPKQIRNNRNRPPRGGYSNRGRGSYRKPNSLPTDRQPRPNREQDPVEVQNKRNDRQQRRSYRREPNQHQKPATDSSSSPHVTNIGKNEAVSKQNDDKNVDQKSQTSNSEKTEPPKDAKEFSSLLNVINKQEKTSKQEKPNRSEPQPSNNTRTTAGHVKMEARRPKRYSSLRQNTGSGDATTNRAWRKSENAPKYTSITKTTHANVEGTSFTQKNDATDHASTHQPLQTVSQSVTTATVHIPTEYPPSQPDLTSVGMPMQYPPPNPHYTHQYYHNPAYQQLCQQMNEQLMVEQQQQQLNNLPPQTDGQTGGVPPEQMSLPPHLNPASIPPHTQGVALLPQQIHLPTPYFTSPVQSSVMPQMAMYPPNLIGQQVGGVTYFNTPSPPSLPPQPVSTNQMSPARRPTSAIPIKSPQSTQFVGLPLTGVE